MAQLGGISRALKRPWIPRFNAVRYESVESNSTAKRSSEKGPASALLSGSNDVNEDTNIEEQASQPLKGREWIKGVVACSWVVASVLLINIILAATASGIAYSKNGEKGFSSASLYQGQCKTAKWWATGLHLVINILSTIMLGASNYCMQCLASPSRAEVDKAHRKRTWLTIGIPNIFDLLVYGKGRRRILGCILLITSLPFHLIYNSAAYYSLGPTEYGVALAQIDRSFDEIPDPDHPDDYNHCVKDIIGMNTTALKAAIKEGQAQRMSVQECKDTFAQDYVSGKSALFLMTKDTMPDNHPLLYVDKGNDAVGFDGKGISIFGWMCDRVSPCMKVNVDEIDNWRFSGRIWTQPSLNITVPTYRGTASFGTEYFDEETVGLPYTDDVARLREITREWLYEEEFQAQLNNASNWINSSWAESITIDGRVPMCGVDSVNAEYEVDHCLSLPTDERCQLFFSPPICLIIIISTIIKLVCMLLTARDDRDEIFLTVGDAIASFITHPDPTTEGMGLLSKTMVRKHGSGWHQNYNDQYHAVGQPPHIEHTPEALSEKKRWAHAVSIYRWLGTIAICVVILGVTGFLLHLGIIGFKEYYETRTVWDFGLGEVTAATLITLITKNKEGSSILGMILLANTPQLLVSIAYFMYNALMTCMVMAAEYDDYAIERKYPRVSWPQGSQRSTYYLSLPYKYSMPLLGVSALLHWLVSQSIFFVEIVPFGQDGQPISQYSLVTCGYSPVAMVFAILVGGLLVIAAGVMGLRPFRSRMPLAVQCSVAISAACHPITKGDHALEPVQWGETSVSVVATVGEPVEGGSNEQDEQDVSNGSDRPMVLESAVFHCSFTSEEVQEPSTSRLYI